PPGSVPGAHGPTRVCPRAILGRSRSRHSHAHCGLYRIVRWLAASADRSSRRVHRDHPPRALGIAVTRDSIRDPKASRMPAASVTGLQRGDEAESFALHRMRELDSYGARALRLRHLTAQPGPHGFTRELKTLAQLLELLVLSGRTQPPHPHGSGRG